MKRVLAVAALTCAALSPARLFAQAPADEAKAEALFQAAKHALDAGHVAEACSLFAQSKEAAPGVGVTLHLADCYERAGDTAKASEQFHEAERIARAQGDSKRADIARMRAGALDAKLPPPASAPAQPAAAVAPPPPPAPVASSTPPAADAPATAKAAPVEPGAEPKISGGGSGRFWAEAVLTVVGLAGLGIGTAFLVRRNDVMNAAASCDPAPTDRADTTGALVAFSAGSMALGSALTLYFTSPPKRPTDSAFTPVPAPAAGGALFRF